MRQLKSQIASATPKVIRNQLVRHRHFIYLFNNLQFNWGKQDLISIRQLKSFRQGLAEFYPLIGNLILAHAL